MANDWEERAARAIERHDDGAARLPEDGDERQRQLTRMGNAAWAAGLSLLVAGRTEEALARLVLGVEAEAEALQGRDDLPAPVADALVALAARDAARYESAIRALVDDFESRVEFLEDTPVADTVLALQLLAQERGLAGALRSELLPR